MTFGNVTVNVNKKFLLIDVKKIKTSFFSQSQITAQESHHTSA